MLIRFRVGQLPKSLRYPIDGTPAVGRYLEMDPAPFEIPAQVVIYDGDEPEVIDCEARTEEDGSTTILLPIGVAPPVGTPIQIILYGDPDAPIVIEGSTANTGLEGILDIDIPDGIRF